MLSTIIDFIHCLINYDEYDFLRNLCYIKKVVIIAY